MLPAGRDCPLVVLLSHFTADMGPGRWASFLLLYSSRAGVCARLLSEHLSVKF